MKSVNQAEQLQKEGRIHIRNEQETDYRLVEEITRNAFYNLYVPGCTEHYLTHIMREHHDFIPELDFVIELDGQVVGNVMYTKAKLVDEDGNQKEILTFGPVSIAPEHQRKGLGKLLLEHSFQQALLLGYDVIVIFGNPGNYVSRGFQSCIKYNVSLEEGVYPAAMMVKELKPGVLGSKKWTYYDSPVMHQIEEAEAERFDREFEPAEKKHQPSQEEFYILSHAVLQKETN